MRLTHADGNVRTINYTMVHELTRYWELPDEQIAYVPVWNYRGTGKQILEIGASL